jgi:hypothetical protein
MDEDIVQRARGAAAKFRVSLLSSRHSSRAIPLIVEHSHTTRISMSTLKATIDALGAVSIVFGMVPVLARISSTPVPPPI